MFLEERHPARIRCNFFKGHFLGGGASVTARRSIIRLTILLLLQIAAQNCRKRKTDQIAVLEDEVSASTSLEDPGASRYKHILVGASEKASSVSGFKNILV